MGRHVLAFAAFVGAPLAGFTAAWAAYATVGEPCGGGRCVFGQPVADTAQAFGLLGVLVGVLLGALIESAE